MTIETMTAFFGWCTVINFGILLASTISLLAFGSFAIRIHSRMFGMDGASLKQAYFQYLAQYKIVTIVLNLVPYLAMKIIGSAESVPLP